MAKSKEHRLADYLADRLMHEDVEVSWMAKAIDGLGERFQIKLFSLFVLLVRQWAIDYEIDTYRSDDHLRMLTNARRIQDTMDHYHIYK